MKLASLSSDLLPITVTTQDLGTDAKKYITTSFSQEINPLSGSEAEKDNKDCMIFVSTV